MVLDSIGFVAGALYGVMPLVRFAPGYPWPELIGPYMEGTEGPLLDVVFENVVFKIFSISSANPSLRHAWTAASVLKQVRKRR